MMYSKRGMSTALYIMFDYMFPLCFVTPRMIINFVKICMMTNPSIISSDYAERRNYPASHVTIIILLFQRYLNNSLVMDITHKVQKFLRPHKYLHLHYNNFS